MKTNRTLIGQFLLLVLFCLLTVSRLFSQPPPDYKFVNGTLVSGTDLQVGAVYRFKNVKPGVDGLITITDLNNATLNELDGASGFNDAFQPSIRVPKKKKGFAEFRLDFVLANTIIPAIMLEVPMTAIDIDGYIYPDEKVYEFDEYQLSLTWLVDYLLLGSALDVKFTGGPLGWVTVTNKTAVDYPGIDTLQRDVMFTMKYAAVSSISFRVGADNKSNTNVDRLRSVYFRKFDFGNYPLPLSDLLSFKGNNRNGAVQLNWTITRENNTRTIVLEKSNDGKQFSTLTAYTVDGQTDFSYNDYNSGATNYYRLRMESRSGKTTYSNVQVFRTGNAAGVLAVYPTLAQDHFTLSVTALRNQTATVNLLDYSGRLVYRTQVGVQEGTNNILISDFNSSLKGNFILTTELDGQVLKSRVVLQ